MDAQTLSLSAFVWRLLRDMLSAQDRLSGRRRCFRRFCADFRNSGTPIFNAPQRRRKICARKSVQKSVKKSAHQNQRKNRSENLCENSASLEEESQEKKTQKKSAPNLCKTPASRSHKQTLEAGSWEDFLVGSSDPSSSALDPAYVHPEGTKRGGKIESHPVTENSFRPLASVRFRLNFPVSIKGR